MGRIEQKRGNHEESLRRYKMAADCFKTVGEIGEWADTMTYLSELLAQQNDYIGAYRLMKDLRSQMQQALRERGIVL